MNAEIGSSEQLFRGPCIGERDLPRLATQIGRIRAWALRVEWFTVSEAKASLEALHAPTKFPETSVSAQIRNLKKPSAGELRCSVEKRRRGAGIWEFRIRAAAAASAPPARSNPAPSVDARKTAAKPRRPIVWPATAAELKAVGYKQASAKTCERCGGRFHWFATRTGKWIPLSILADDKFTPHFAVCGRGRAALREDETICRAELEAYSASGRPAPPAQRSLF